MPLDALGFFTLCLCHQWNDGPLPAGLEELAMLVGRPLDDVKRLWPLVEPCFEFGADATGAPGWINLRLQREFEVQSEKHMARVRAGEAGGKRSGESRRDRSQSNAAGLVEANGKQNGSNASPLLVAKPNQPEPEPESDAEAEQLAAGKERAHAHARAGGYTRTGGPGWPDREL